jgi:intein/homing endonuclease
MSLDKITDDELNFVDFWFTPKALLEILFHDWDNLSAFDAGDKFGELRLYQYSMLSDESLIDFDLTKEQLNLDRKQIFQMKKMVSDIYCLGARKFGKSQITMIMDMLNSMMTSDGDKVAFASVDMIHIKQILDSVKICLENHPICKSFVRRISGSPDFKIELKNNYILNSVNMNIGAKNPGSAWLGKHVYRIMLEEFSLESDESYEKRKDAISELGAIYRCSGMTDYTPQSPAGQAYYNPENRRHILNYPQYVNPYWDEKEKKKRIEQYNGEQSVGFRIYVKGEVVEDGLTSFDMQRVRQMAIDDKKTLKTVEINKERFKHFKAFLILDRPSNSDRIFVNADIGLNVTEINIISEVKGKYEYLYNVTLNNLIDDEQADIFKYIAQLLKANIISLDCGDGSIDENEFVTYKQNELVKYCRAKELPNIGSNISVPTWRDNKLEWKPATVYSHSYTGDMLRITSSPGNCCVKVTPNHSVMVYTETGLIMKRADCVSVDDWMLSPKATLLNNDIGIQTLEYKAKKQNKYSPDTFIAINVDCDLAYLLGWAVAEGCSKTTSYQLTLGNDEKDKAIELIELSRKLFNNNSGYINTNKYNTPHLLRGKIINKNSPTYTAVLGGGKGVLEFFSKNCGCGSHNKKVPTCIFNSPNYVKEAFLKGLLEGDGNTRTKHNVTEYCIKSASEELAFGLVLLLQQLGMYPTVSSRNDHNLPSYAVSWTNTKNTGKWTGVPYSVIPLKYGKTRKNKKTTDISALESHRVSPDKINKLKELLSSQWCFKKVTKVEKYRYDGVVYDLMVEDNNTFVAGIGNVLIHNTGRALYGELAKTIPLENLVWYAGTNKIQTGFLEDKDGNVIIEKGSPVIREEFMSEWSVSRLKALLYSGQLIIPEDFKFITQISKVVSTKSGDRVIYKCLCPQGDHLFDSFKVFAIAEWQKNNASLTPKIQDTWGCGATS